MKPDAWRLDPAAYPFAMETPTRFGDLDPLGHLNNVAVGRFYEEGRVRFSALFDARALWGPGGRVLVARVAIDYLAEGRYPAPVAVCTGVLRTGGASYTYAQLLLQDGRAIGVADTVLVYTDGTRPAPLPSAFRDALAERTVVGAPSAAP